MNSRTRLLALALALLGTAACDNSTGRTTGPSSPLAGEWRTLPVPSGGHIDLSLTSSGDRVTGLGTSYGLMGRFDDSLTITGRRNADASFDLTVTYSKGAVATYTGQMVGMDQLSGFWSSGISNSDATRLDFNRQ